MIAYRFQNLRDHPHHGVLVEHDKPSFAMFFTPQEAKEIAPPRITVAKIQADVASYYGITAEHMRSKSRDRNHVYPRQIAMLLCRELTKASLPDIGDRFGKRHHTTVIWAIDQAKARIAESPTTETEYETVRARVLG